MEKIKKGNEAALGMIGLWARKPMGFLGPAHDESWSAGRHIILLIKARTESWKKKEPRNQVYSKLLDLPRIPGI